LLNENFHFHVANERKFSLLDQGSEKRNEVKNIKEKDNLQIIEEENESWIHLRCSNKRWFQLIPLYFLHYAQFLRYFKLFVSPGKKCIAPGILLEISWNFILTYWWPPCTYINHDMHRIHTSIMIYLENDRYLQVFSSTFLSITVYIFIVFTNILVEIFRWIL